MFIKIVLLFATFLSLFACSDKKESKSDCGADLEVNETEICNAPR